jgi:hypothetical protein
MWAFSGLAHGADAQGAGTNIATEAVVLAPADTKANPGKITMASPFSVRPPRRAHQPRESLRQRDQQLELPSSARRSKNAARLKREIEFDRRRPAQIQSTSSTQL